MNSVEFEDIPLDHIVRVRRYLDPSTPFRDAVESAAYFIDRWPTKVRMSVDQGNSITVTANGSDDIDSHHRKSLSVCFCENRPDYYRFRPITHFYADMDDPKYSVVEKEFDRDNIQDLVTELRVLFNV